MNNSKTGLHNELTLTPHLASPATQLEPLQTCPLCTDRQACTLPSSMHSGLACAAHVHKHPAGRGHKDGRKSSASGRPPFSCGTCARSTPTMPNAKTRGAVCRDRWATRVGRQGGWAPQAKRSHRSASFTYASWAHLSFALPSCRGVMSAHCVGPANMQGRRLPHLLLLCTTLRAQMSLGNWHLWKTKVLLPHTADAPYEACALRARELAHVAVKRHASMTNPDICMADRVNDKLHRWRCVECCEVRA